MNEFNMNRRQKTEKTEDRRQKKQKKQRTEDRLCFSVCLSFLSSVSLSSVCLSSVLCLLFLCPLSSSTVRADDGPSAKPIVVHFELLPTKHIVVNVKVNGKGPYRLIFDTGIRLFSSTTSWPRKRKFSGRITKSRSSRCSATRAR